MLPTLTIVGGNGLVINLDYIFFQQRTYVGEEGIEKNSSKNKDEEEGPVNLSVSHSGRKAGWR